MTCKTTHEFASAPPVLGNPRSSVALGAFASQMVHWLTECVEPYDGESGGQSSQMEWVKYTYTYADFACADRVKRVEILPAINHRAYVAWFVKHTQAFTGGDLTGYSLNLLHIPTTSPLAKDPFHMMWDYDVLGEPALDDPKVNGGLNVGMTPRIIYYEPFTVNIVAFSSGDDLDAATQGSVDVWLLTRTMEFG